MSENSNFLDTIESKATGLTSSMEQAVKAMSQPQTQLIGVARTLNDVLNTVKGLVQPFSQVQESAVQLVKSVGLAKDNIMGLATRVVEQNQKMKLSMAYNVSSPEMINTQLSLMKAIGRNVQVDMAGIKTPDNENFDSEIENILGARQIFGGDDAKLAQMVAGYDKIGRSMKAAGKVTGKLFQEAGEYGINFQKYSEAFMNNMQMVQTYTFKNGIDGLREMARTATEIRQDMSQVAAFADRVGTVTGAVETAAQLQVLGGSFAALANPMGMLHDSLVDMESLQKTLTGMTQGAAFYNRVTHQIEMDPFTRMQLKRAAEVSGQDPAKFIDQAYAQARRGEIERQLQGIGNLTEDFAKMAVNIGTIDENGQAGVMVDGKFKSLSDIATLSAGEQKDIQDKLVDENRTISDDVKVIAKSVIGIEGKISGNVKQLENAAAYGVMAPGPICGTSAYDAVLNFVNNDFSPRLMDAVQVIETTTLGTIGVMSTALNKLNTNFLEIAAAKNPGEAGQIAGEAVRKNLPEGPRTESIADTVGNSVKSFYDWLENKANTYTKEKAGYNIFAGRDSAGQGLVGGDTYVAKVGTQIEGISPEALETFKNSFGGAGTVIIGTTPQGQVVSFNTSPNSVPGSSVAPFMGASTQTGAGGQAGSDFTQTVKHEFTVNGKFTFDGDKGKITEKELMDLFAKNPSFANQFMSMLEKAIGQNANH